MKYKIKIIFLVILFLSIVSCEKDIGNTLIENYSEKIEDGKVDKNVAMEYSINKAQGKIHLKFLKKEIPLKLNLTPEGAIYSCTLKISGKLAKGKLSFMLDRPGFERIWLVPDENSLIMQEHLFELYWGDYILNIDFEDAEDGNLIISYQFNEV